MVEGLLRCQARQKRASTEIRSAGLDAVEGHPPDPVSRELLKTVDIDIKGHRARQLNADLVRQSDLILVMESWHKDELLARHPESRGKVFTLGHWMGWEVRDPYRRSRETYLAEWRKIRISVDSWSKRIWH